MQVSVSEMLLQVQVALCAVEEESSSFYLVTFITNIMFSYYNIFIVCVFIICIFTTSDSLVTPARPLALLMSKGAKENMIFSAFCCCDGENTAGRANIADP